MNLPTSLYLRIGKYFEHRGNFVAAKKFYEKGLAGDDANAQFHIGNLEYRSRNYDNAVEHLVAAIAGGAGGELALDRLIKSLKVANNSDAAISSLEVKFGSDSSNGELKKAIASIREAAQVPVHNGGGGGARSNAGSGKKAKSTAKKTPPKNIPAWQKVEWFAAERVERPRDAELAYGHATALEEAGRLPEAAHAFDDACRLSSRSWWWYRCARAHELAGNAHVARDRYERAISGDRKLGAKRWGAGVFHQEAKCWDLAASEFERMVPDVSEAWRRAGLFYRAAKNYFSAMDFEAAERCFSEALKLRPANAEWAYELAQVLELSGKLGEAAAQLEMLEAYDALGGISRTELRWSQGRIAYLLGEYQAAVDFLRDSLGMDTLSKGEPDSSDETRQEPKAGDRSSGGPGLRTATYFGASADRRGHRERARIAQLAGDIDAEYSSLRMAELLSSSNADELADRLSEVHVEYENFARAAETLLRTRVFWGPHPADYEHPKDGTYASKLAAYTEWSRNLPVEQDVILYESNLGLSVDCNPLAICRKMLAGEVDSKAYLHVWSVDGDVTLPEDLLEHDDVLVVAKDSLQYTRLLATAKYLINNSTFPTYFTRRDEQRYLMTWHGTPLKTLAKDMPEPLVHLNMARNYLQATLAIFPNEHTRRVLIEGTDVHGLLSADVGIFGYPRNDLLAQTGVAEPSSEDTLKILYAPTWREDSELENQVRSLLDVRDKILALGHTPLLRAHHYVESAATKADPSIQFVPRRIPTNDLLGDADMLITDFSSIYFDYAITRKPIIFYIPDWERYTETRGVYFDRPHFPGPVCEDVDTLGSLISTVEVDQGSRTEFLRKFAPRDDGNASLRVARKFFSDIDEQPAGATKMEDCATRGLLIRQSFIPNGMTTSFVNLVTHMARRGVPVTALTDGRSVQNEEARQGTLSRLPREVRVIGRVGMQPKSSLEYHASIAAGKLTGRLPSSLQAVLDRLYSTEARRVLPVAGFDAVIEFDGYSEFMARLVWAIGERSKVSAVYLHNDILDEIRLRMPALKGVVDLLPRFDRVIAVSEGSSHVNAEKLSSAYGIATSNFTFARNAIVPDGIREKASEGLAPDIVALMESAEVALVQVGRISPEKNHMFSLDVVSSLREKGIDCQLMIVGDGPLADRVKSRIQQLGLAGSVHMIGWVDNPYPFIRLCDAMILPSHHEGQPMVILEAQTIGTPVIGSNISSLEAMGADGPKYILPLNVDAWVNCIAQLKNFEEVDSSRFDGELYAEEAILEFNDALGVRLG